MLNKKSFSFVLVLFFKFLCLQASFLDDSTQKLLSRRTRSAEECLQKVDSYGGTNNICVTMSTKINKQVGMLHHKGESAIIIDPNQQRYGFLKKQCGCGIVIDEGLGNGYVLPQGGRWANNSAEIISVNISELVSEVKPQPVDNLLNVTTHAEYISEVLYDFGINDLKSVKPSEQYLTIFTGIREKFQSLIGYMTTVLAPVLSFDILEWTPLKYGLIDFFNVFKWINKFISSIYGGVSTLLGQVVQLSLKPILRAKHGLEAFVVLLRQLVDKFDFAQVMKAIVEFPHKLGDFISGLGGEIMQGITGVFKIVSSIVKLLTAIASKPIESITSMIASSVAHIAELILRFFESRQERVDDYTESVNQVLDILEQQKTRYNNAPGLAKFEGFMHAYTGKGSMLVADVDVAQCFKILNTNSYGSVIDVTVAVFRKLSPVISWDVALPNLMYSTLRTLNSPGGLDELEQAIPGLNATASDGAEASMRSLPTEDNKDLATADLIKKFPVASQILKSFEDAAQNEAIGENVEDVINSKHHVNDELKDALLRYGSY